MKNSKAPAAYGAARLSPKNSGARLAEFQKNHPKVTMIELVSTDSIINLIEEHIDIAIRMADLKDSSIIAKRLCSNHFITCASPSYLKNAPPLKTPADLKNHPILFLDAHRDLTFQNSEVSLDELLENRHFTCNDGGVLTQLATQGASISDSLRLGRPPPRQERSPDRPIERISAQMPQQRLDSTPVKNQFGQESANFGRFPDGQAVRHIHLVVNLTLLFPIPSFYETVNFTL